MNKANYTDLENYQIKTFIDCYRILRKLLSSTNYSITKKEILALIDFDKTAPQRTVDKTVERQNNKIRILFNFSEAEYYYNRKAKCYTLSIDNISKLAHFKVLYDYLTVTLLANKFDKDELNISKTFQLSSKETYKSIPLLFQLIEAINTRKVIQFAHYNHFTGKTEVHKVEPWFIKHFDNEFYLGTFRLEKSGEKNQSYRHFTVSQVLADSLVVLDEEINLKRKEEKYPYIVQDVFESCLGIRIYKEDNPFEKCFRGTILVETDFTTAQNWLNRPIHTNLKPIENTEGKYLFEFTNFYFNETLKQLLIANASKIKVLSPPVVINEIKETLIKSLEFYK